MTIQKASPPKTERGRKQKYKKLVDKGRNLLFSVPEMIVRDEWNAWFSEIDTLADTGFIQDFWEYAQGCLAEQDRGLFGFTLHEYLMDPNVKDLNRKKGSLILLPVLMLKESCLKWGSQDDQRNLAERICSNFRRQGWLLEEGAQKRISPSPYIWKTESWLGMSILSKYRLRGLEGRWQYLKEALEEMDLEKEDREMIMPPEEDWMSGVLPIYIEWNKREWVDRMEKRSRPDNSHNWETLLESEYLWIGAPTLFLANALIGSTVAVLKHLSNERGYFEARWEQGEVVELDTNLKITYKIQYKKNIGGGRYEIWTSQANFWVDKLIKNHFGADGEERMLDLLNKRHVFFKK